MTRGRAAAALIAAGLLTGCGVPSDEAPRALDASSAPFRFYEVQPSPGSGEGRVALYFVRGDRVVLQTRAVERSTSIEELLDLLLEGPTPEQVEAGTQTALPTALSFEDVRVGSNGVAVVTLGGGTQVGTSPLGFAQIVATLTAPGRAGAVRVRLDGEDVRVPRGDASLTDEPVDRDDYAELLALASAAPSPSPSAPVSPSAAPS